MEKGFNRENFMMYMEYNFSGFDNPFLRKTIDNIIDYGLKNKRVSKDQFIYFLVDMIPEIEFGEAAQFIDDDCLTTNGIEIKCEWKEKYYKKLRT